MKLLFVSRYFPNMFGGVFDYTHHLSRGLAEKGMEVYILTSKDERGIKNGQGIMNNDYAIDGKGYVKLLLIVERWSFGGLPQILRGIKKVNPDWIILQYVPYMYSYYGVPLWISLFCLWLNFLGFRIITTFHEVYIKFQLIKPKYWIIALLQRVIAYILALSSKKVTTNNDFYKKILEIWNKDICKIPVGSNLPVQISFNKETLRKRISPNGELIISTFGTKAVQAGSGVLLTGIKKYLENYRKSLKLVFIGGSPTALDRIKAFVRQLKIESYCFFTEYVSASQAYCYLAISDVFMQIETRFDYGVSTKSTTLASAFAAGLPIIGNRGILTDDFFKDNVNIIFTKPNGTDIAEKLALLLNNNDLRKKLAKNSKEYYYKFLTWEKIATSYMNFIQMRYNAFSK